VDEEEKLPSESRLQEASMALVKTTFVYGSAPQEEAWQALDDVRDVYGIQQISFDDKAREVHVEYEGSSMTDGDVAELLRDAGVDLRERVWDE